MDIPGANTSKSMSALWRFCCVVTAMSLLSLSNADETRQQQIDQLGKSLTPMGANPKGNADNTIPPYTATILGAPAFVQYDGTGTFYPSAYANEKPLFIITAKIIASTPNT